MPTTVTTIPQPSLGLPFWAFLEGLGNNNAMGDAEYSGQPSVAAAPIASGRTSGIAYPGDQPVLSSVFNTPDLPPVPESSPRADAIRADFEAIRNGQVQSVPPMAAVTSNPQLLAQDNRMNQLAQLRDTLASMNPQERKPEPVAPASPHELECVAPMATSVTAILA